MLSHIRYMARYNIWQNDSIYGTADTLTDPQRREDRGLFFRSIHETLNHILWADKVWMSRFSDVPPPEAPGIPGSTSQFDDWEALKQARISFDTTVKSWTDSLSEADIEGDLSWYSGAMQADITKPLGVLIAHMFNHQTHHRGQVHAALTGFGAKPQDTDMPFMPEGYL